MAVNIHEQRSIHESAWRESYPHFVRVIKEQGLDAGVEIGVSFGGHAEAILDGTDVSELVGVDPYEHRAGYDDPLNFPQADFDNLFWYAMGRLSRYGSRYVHLRGTSAQAAAILNAQLDFAYLDGDHGYEAVKQDLSLWYPKLRVGGVIGGHDFGHADFPGVRRAVDEFVAANGLELKLEPASVWWAKKLE